MGFKPPQEQTLTLKTHTNTITKLKKNNKVWERNWGPNLCYSMLLLCLRIIKNATKRHLL